MPNQVEDAITKLLSIRADDMYSQQLAIDAVASIDDELKTTFSQQSIIWDQIIRCFTKHREKQSPIPQLLFELKQLKMLSHYTNGLSWPLQNTILTNKPAKQYLHGNKLYAGKVLSNLMCDLQNYQAQLKRDNTILYDEQQLMRKMVQDQKKALSFMDKLYVGLSERKTSPSVSIAIQSFIRNELLYTLQTKRNELRLQNQITEQGILNLELMLNTNHTLVSRLSMFLTSLLETLKMNTQLLWLMNKT